MVKTFSANPEDLFEEIVALGFSNGIFDEDGYYDLVNETIEDHRRLAELHDDQRLQELEDALRARFGEYEKRMELGG